MSHEQQQPVTFPPLVVATDPVAANRATRAPFVATVCLTAACAVIAILSATFLGSVSGVGLGLLSAMPFTFLFAYQLFLAIRLAFARGAQSVARTVLVVDAEGLHGSTIQGDVVIPWAAIDRVSIRPRGKHRIVTFHLVPGVSTTSPGVRTTLAPALFATIAKRGFAIGSAAVATPVETIADAARAFTGGRLALR